MAGKVTNCQVEVSPHLASNDASVAVNWRLAARKLGSLLADGSYGDTATFRLGLEERGLAPGGCGRTRLRPGT